MVGFSGLKDHIYIKETFIYFDFDINISDLKVLYMLLFGSDIDTCSVSTPPI